MRKSAARGASARQSGFSIHAAMKRSAADAAAAAPTSSGERSPAGRCRLAVRGLAASRKRSARRLTLMARVRAPAMASVTHTSTCQPGQPSAASTIAT